MAHSGDGTGWDITAPADTDQASDGAQEIRDLRTGVGIRIDKEHVTLAASSAGGEHKAGSAKAYQIDEDAAEPTLRPDGSTALAAADIGRLTIEADVGGWSRLQWYDGTNGWHPVSGAIKSGGITVPASGWSSFVDVEYPFRGVLLYHSSGNNACVVITDDTADAETTFHCADSSDTTTSFYFNSKQDGSDSKFRVKRYTTASEATWRYLVF